MPRQRHSPQAVTRTKTLAVVPRRAGDRAADLERGALGTMGMRSDQPVDIRAQLSPQVGVFWRPRSHGGRLRGGDACRFLPSISGLTSCRAGWGRSGERGVAVAAWQPGASDFSSPFYTPHTQSKED